MGSKSTKLWEHGRLQIITNGSNFVPGQVVSGTINAQLDQSYPGKQLTIEIVGVEKVKFTTNQGKHSHTVKNKHEAVHTTSVIQIFQNGILSAG